MASQPKDQHCYLVHNFAEFEALVRRALHEDLPTGSYIQDDLSRCSSLCDAGKDCCDVMASCKCGTHTGQYDCICEKGYYGKGLKHECTACPPGTYKPEATPGGLSTCLSCPDTQHTSQPGSTSLDDCICKPGYQPIGMTCQVVYCPALSPPENGIFVQNAVSTLTCQANSQWSGTVPRCVEVRCPPIVNLKNILVSPPVCLKRAVSLGFICHLSCRQDTEPPWIQCPADIVAQTDERRGTSNISWNAPTATDNSNEEVVVQMKPVYSPPQLLPIGKETITYIATDRSGNQANCSFTVTVIDTEPPFIDRCRSPPTVQATNTETAVNWEVPQFSDNSRGRLTVTSSHSPGSLFPVGETLVQYTATDAAGNRHTCNLTITVQGTTCEQPYIPVNGEFICSEEDEGVNCTLHCKDGYSFAQDAIHSYFCAHNGVWEPPYSPDRPDCSLNRIANNGFKPFEMLFKASRCDDADLVKSFTGNFNDKLGGMLPGICSSDEITCKLEVMSQGHCLEYNYDYENGFSIAPASIPLPSSRNDSVEVANQKRLLRTLEQLTNRLKRTLAKQQLSNFHVSSEMIVSDPRSLESKKASLFCRPGSVLKGRMCVQCPVGTYFSLEYNECESCWLGSYQDQEGQLECKSCPEGTATAYLHSRSVAECKGASSIQRCSSFGSSFLAKEESVTAAPEVEVIEDYQASSQVFHECFLNPCQNKGTCEEVGAGYVCTCTPGFTGAKCEIDINECDSSPCQNGGLCKDGMGDFQCQCKLGFLGSLCEAEINECLSSPCLNEGVCVDEVNRFTCSCADGFTGFRCELEINECQSSPCLNGGVCEDLTGGYSCNCAVGFSGDRCEINIDDCYSAPCLNRGLCIDAVNSYRCQCVEGYRGRLCEVDVDECDPNPCVNGASCLDGLGSFTCRCLPGFNGTRCETEMSSAFNLDFEVSGIHGYVMMDGVMPVLTEITCTFWMRSSDTTNYGTPVSYAVDGSDNAFLLIDYNGWVLYVNGKERITDCPAVNTGQWYHIGVSWRSWDGDWRIYINGRPSDGGKGLSVGTTIPGGGALVLGQDQDQRGEGFNPVESFVGSISQLHIWDRVLTPQQIKVLASSCPASHVTHRGNVLAWPDFLNGVAGRVKVNLNSIFCADCPKLENAVPHLHVSSVETHCSNSGKWGGHPPACLDVDECALGSDCDDHASCQNTDGSYTCTCIHPYSGDGKNCTEPVKCQNPGSPEFGHRDGSNFLMGSEVVFGCDNGYELVGSSRLSCLESGAWDHPVPYCRALSCATPAVPENSLLKGNNFTYGSKVTFSCKTGYLPQIPYEFQCLSTLRWSGTPPACYPVTCGGPPTVEHADYIFDTNTYLSTVNYTCVEGYRPQSSMEVLCQWSDDFLQCVPRSCGPPPIIDHAVPHETHKLFGDTASYYCTDGYTASNNSKLVCNAQGVWVPPEGMETPHCIANFCLRPPDPLHAILDSINKPKYASNTEVSYKCEEGFMLNTTATLRCLMGGAWEPLPSDIGCVPVRCSKPESIDRGYVRGTNYSFGAVVAYSCETGYMIRGEKRRTCKANGEWGGVLPTCVPVSCSTPPTLENGYIQVKGRFTFNNKVTYACNAGYRLIGRPERLCQANRQWSNHDPPTCVLLTCEDPPDIVHGQYKGSEFQVGYKVEYVCDEGYELAGDGVWTCLKYGKWDKMKPPRCSPVRCPEPPLEENHLVLKGLDSESGTVELSCEDGYILEGAHVLRCTPSQEWNDTFPVCKQVFCGPPPEVTFGSMSSAFPPFSFSSTVTYMCVGGFTLRKEASVTCLTTGQWSKPYPECIPVECPQPVEISNGIVDVQGLMYLSKALYSCKAGYDLVGNSTVLCGEKGLWVGGVPSCRPVECSIPKQIASGKVVYRKLQFGHSATYSCRRGYRLKGPQTLRCLANGAWHSDPPACVQISCSPPQPIENGFVEGQDHSFGVTIFYSCFPGFQLLGQDHLTCEEFGWSSPVPVCVPSDCGLPPHIDFGDYVRVTESDPPLKDSVTASLLDLNFLHRTVIEYRCHLGYNISSHTRLVCQEDGKWNGTAPSCLPAECETPPSPEHGLLKVTDSSLGSVVRYSCEDGYELVGEAVRQCLSGQLWTSEAPVCRPISCGDPGAVANGTSHGGEFVYPEVLHFECNPGFVLRGSDTIACQVDGRWNGPKPFCDPVSCGPPKLPDDVTSEVKEYTYNSEIELTCPPGFLLKGMSRSVCQADGSWSHGSLSCVPALCGKPSPVTHGNVLGSQFGYNSRVKYKCDEGYRLSGDTTLVCQSDGLWDKPPPRCDIISCDPPEDISHGFVNGSSFNYNDVVEYVCFHGYQVVGDPVLQCSSQGVWVGSVPRCQPCVCPPPELQFGRVIGNGHACGNQVQFQCDGGYRRLGPAQALCEKGVWSPGVPVCSRGRCSTSPPVVQNAVLQGGMASFPDTVAYKCRLGYLLKGPPHLSCGRDGRWAEPRLRCEPVSCGKPPIVAHAEAEGEVFIFPNQITYRCEDGYELATQMSSLSCQSDGTWSKHIIQCRPTPCRLPGNISTPHLVISGKELTSVGGTITLSCPPGLYLQGAALAECQMGGGWAPDIFSVSCEVVVCEKPPPLLHGVVEGDSYNYGDFILYSCLPDFEMKGDSVQTCQGDGTWSGAQPVCVVSSMHSCGPPPSVKNAQLQATGDLNNISYLCSAGLQLVGPKTLTCLTNGSWSTPLPTCETVRGCEGPKQLLHGKVQEHSLNTGHALEFQCDKGYGLVGDHLVVCMGGHTWSSAFPTCQAKSCPPPPGWKEDNSSNRSQKEFPVGRSVRVTCPRGQQVKGSGTITCRPDQTWSPLSSVCETMCWLQCQNGGVCQRPNICACPEGWMGRLCEEPICILPCLNGGRCVAPYHCDCPTGWTGTRCHTAMCLSPCLNGGRCIRPNRCSCSPGWSGHNCSRKRKSVYYHF
uniref:Sushi, von Willebrand factor type A, EGF and pentraxin domain containing 1 n=2 Tax=Iconisemion striatum TaxID=60296 RepID=A0A1A7X820_9TELE